MDEQGDNFPLDDHIWSFDKFRDFLIEEYGYENTQVETAFIANLKRLFLYIFKTFKDVFPQRNGYWLLNGLDVAVDHHWNVYALEINANPSLHYNTRVWGKNIVQNNFRLASEVLELVLDAQAKTRQEEPVTRRDLVMKTKGGFELIYSEQVSPPFEADESECFQQDPLLTHPPKAAAQQISAKPKSVLPNKQALAPKKAAPSKPTKPSKKHSKR